MKILLIAMVTVVVIDAGFVLGFPHASLPPKNSPADAIVVLGAAPNSPAIRNRASLGYALYGQGRANAIVLSGGHTASRDESEAMNMARYLTKGKNTSVPLVLEENSNNTYENLQNSRGLVPTAKSILIVSDAYHLARAFLIAKHLGYTDVYWDSPPSSYYRPHELAWYYVREMVAIFDYISKFLR